MNLGNKYNRGPYLIKIARAKIFIVVFFILVILTFDYIFRGSLPSSSLQVTTTHNGLVPEMQHDVMINSVGKTPLVLKVFYECLCPDSKSFFIKHLMPSIMKAPKLISAVLVPYGKAKTTTLGPDEYRFKCQHGERECFGNKIHACVIEKVQDILIKVQLLTCMINDNIDPEEIGQKCCASYKIDWQPIHACALGKEGGILLKRHGDETNSLIPRVSFIPTVLINGHRGNQAAILKNLWKELCQSSDQMSLEHEDCRT